MSTTADLANEVDDILAELRALGSEDGRAGMARFGINTEKAFGVSIAAARPLRADTGAGTILRPHYGRPASTRRASLQPLSTTRS